MRVQMRDVEVVSDARLRVDAPMKPTCLHCLCTAKSRCQVHAQGVGLGGGGGAHCGSRVVLSVRPTGKGRWGRGYVGKKGMRT